VARSAGLQGRREALMRAPPGAPWHDGGWSPARSEGDFPWPRPASSEFHQTSVRIMVPRRHTGAALRHLHGLPQRHQSRCQAIGARSGPDARRGHRPDRFGRHAKRGWPAQQHPSARIGRTAAGKEGRRRGAVLRIVMQSGGASGRSGRRIRRSLSCPPGIRDYAAPITRWPTRDEATPAPSCHRFRALRRKSPCAG